MELEKALQLRGLFGLWVPEPARGRITQIVVPSETPV